jgi:hypothetical protein
VLVTPLARPAAPTLTALTVGDGSISASFTAGNKGDRDITGYQYSVDGGATWRAASGTTSPIVVTGLNNGTLYTVALRAVSSAGVGVASNTLQGTPYTYPSAPDTAAIVANGGNGQITVSWAAANLNGGILLNYTATAYTGPDQRNDGRQLLDHGSHVSDHGTHQRHDVLRHVADREQRAHVQRAVGPPGARDTVDAARRGHLGGGDGRQRDGHGLVDGSDEHGRELHLRLRRVVLRQRRRVHVVRHHHRHLHGDHGSHQRLELHLRGVRDELQRHRTRECGIRLP